SAPMLFNVTLVGRAPDNVNGGEGTSRGQIYRVGSAGKMSNMIVTNFSDFAMLVDSASSINAWNQGDLVVKSSIFFNNPTAGWANTAPQSLADGGVPPDMFDEAAKLSEASLANRDTDPQLTDATNVTAPNFKPKAGSPALTGGATPAGDTFFDP